ncbi:MAG: PD-(D/E)XK nuclease family protein [Phycisphaeraceae bacterium]|nr:PD-(D/E)XK nuclease family protein [Phycisphaeraceae bacterium]
MAAERIFLGWDAPALPRVAAWLRQRFGELLDQPILAVPAANAGRRLLELLVEQAGGALACQPDIVTLGRLPERLYQSPLPIADDWTAQLAWLSALRHLDGEMLRPLLPQLPDENDLSAWWALGQQLDGLRQDLAAAGMTLEKLIERTRQLNLDCSGGALPRFEAILSVERAYLADLQARGLCDQQQARMQAIASRTCALERPIVLICTPDLNQQLARMLALLPGEVIALIHAPDEQGEGFDGLGRFVSSHWRRQQPPIAGDQLHFTDRPADQARLVVETLQSWSVAANQVTVGLIDTSLAAMVRRGIEHAGASARDAAGRPLGCSRPATLLRALGEFASSHRFDAFAALLRHPDITDYVAQLAGTEDWLTLLDEYAQRHLHGRLFGQWLTEGDRQVKLKRMWDRIAPLAPPPQEQRKLPQWSQPIAAALEAVYGRRALHRYAPEDHSLVSALEMLGNALRQWADMDVTDDLAPTVDFAAAINLLLQSLESRSVPEPADASAIELAGLLELPLDDAPHLILVGLNELSQAGGDPFLPDSVRRSLGLPDSEHRLARDRYLLSAMLHSRKVALIAGRSSGEGEPMAPSRLLLACDDQQLVDRIAAFYAEANDEDASPPAALLTPGDGHLLIPLPQDSPSINELPVTAFRDYLACPYRFYLKHVLKLCGIDDHVVEMDALAFGSLAHELMQGFAQSDLRDSAVAQDIARFLGDQLDALARRRFGSEPSVLVQLQIEQLRQRMNAMAARQAQWRSEGWRIDPKHIERDMKAQIVVDDQPFTVTGRIDRIDIHDALGYRILDYKTSERGRSPQQTHRKRSQWQDLQLPLYLDLATARGISGTVALGYINLPKKVSEVDLKLAAWSDEELSEARNVRDQVIRNVRAGNFWPPKERPQFEDDFSGICADGAFDRAGLIRASERAGRP